MNFGRGPFTALQPRYLPAGINGESSTIQSDLTYLHTSVLNEIADIVRELNK